MSMTKKDFNAMAAALNDEVKQLEMLREDAADKRERDGVNDEIAGVVRSATTLCSVFLEANPRFNNGRFMDAVLKNTAYAEVRGMAEVA